MTHFPTHERRAFLEWIDAGFPDVATVEENYEPKEILAVDLLRRFLLPAGCTDVMPKAACEDVATEVGYDADASGMTYAIAASALLVQRAAGDDAAGKFLALLIEGEGY